MVTTWLNNVPYGKELLIAGAVILVAAVISYIESRI